MSTSQPHAADRMKPVARAAGRIVSLYGLLVVPLVLLALIILSTQHPDGLSNDDTRLLNAAHRGDIAGIDAALRGGASLSATDEQNLMPLIIAARAGRADAVSHLLDHGACTEDVGDAMYGTALTQAAALGHHDVLRVLLRHDADPDAISKQQYSVLWMAILCADGGPEPVAALLAAGASPNLRCRGGQTPLMLAVSMGKLDAVGMLLAAGADPDMRSNDGRSAWSLAADQTDILRILKQEDDDRSY